MGRDTPPTEFHIYFIAPTLPAGQILVTNTESSVVEVWFFRSDKDYYNEFYIKKNNQEQMRQRGGERMTGRVAIKWNNNGDFVIGADLDLPKDNSIGSSTFVVGKRVGIVFAGGGYDARKNVSATVGAGRSLASAPDELS
jgi:hypothetical protein